MRVGAARAVALLSVGLLVAGCTAITGGKAQPPSRLTTLTGPAIRRALVGDRTLSRILQQPFMIDDRRPPRYGGPETLQDFESPAPVGCLGVAEMLHHSVYLPGKVNDVAVETWRHAATPTKVTSVKEGVVSLPSEADANALFSRFAQQWQRCDGQSVVLPDRVLRLKAKIANIQVAPAVLAGNVWIGFDAPGDTTSIPAGRALGVRGNCLVEVEVDFFNASNRSMQGSGIINASAVDIARAMMDKVSP